MAGTGEAILAVEAIIEDLQLGQHTLAAITAEDWRRDVAGLADGARAEVVAKVTSRIHAADPADQSRIAAVLGIDIPIVKEFDSRLTDVANGVRLAGRYGGRLRFVKEWGWLVWDGRRWARDDNGSVPRMAKETARSIYNEAAAAPDEKAAAELARWAKASHSLPKLKAMIECASSEAGVVARPGDFDQHPMLLNVLNGVLDLRTGELRPHDRDLFLTRLAPVDYDPDARCDRWLRFLADIFEANDQVIDFVQRAIGYTLTGDTGEQCLFLCHGGGANGKTTLLELMRGLLGDYGQTADFQAFLARRPDDHGPSGDLARMAGARFIAAIESGEGASMNERVVKQLTGGDTIAARYLHREFFEFRPSAKFWLASNHKPTISGTDDAIWRRFHNIPFNVTIPAKDRDPRLLDKLRAELTGVLAWAVRGCLAWQREGLNAPEKITKATAEYRTEQDAIGNFITDCCIEHPQASAAAAALYEAYVKWGGTNSAKRFGMRMGERGFRPDRGPGGVRIRCGIGLAARSET